MSKFIISGLVVLVGSVSTANTTSVPKACLGFVNHTIKVELGEDIETLDVKTSVIGNQEDFELLPNQARVETYVRENGGAFDYYASTVTYIEKRISAYKTNYSCEVSDIDAIPNGF